MYYIRFSVWCICSCLVVQVVGWGFLEYVWCVLGFF